MSVQSYSPLLVNLFVTGVAITGYADGTFIEAKRDKKVYTKKVGAHGDITRTRSADKSGTITIHLHQSSPANDALSALVIADELAQAGTIVFPVMIKDLSGTTLISAPDAWIEGYADAMFAEEVGNRAWVFHCGTMAIFNGGNS